jgi:hypothetical protein
VEQTTYVQAYKPINVSAKLDAYPNNTALPLSILPNKYISTHPPVNVSAKPGEYLAI